jgi:PAS domain S-box-containing protein
MLALMTDVTDRRRAEDALRASEARFRQLAEHIHEAFFVIEMPSGQALYISPTWGEIWGRSVDAAYADSQLWFNAIHPDDRAEVVAGQAAIGRGQPATNVFRVQRPDGSERWVRGRTFPVVDASGVVYRMVGVAEDITELRKTEDQLLKAQKMEAVGRLAGGIAHDFNNVLTAIFGYVEMVVEDLPSGSQARADLDEVLKAAGRAASLTRQLLAFSRQQVLQPTVLQINDVVQDLEKMLRRVIGEDLELRVTLAPDAGKVRADVGQLEQVVLNLAVNARDAMPTGGKLTIETVNAGLTEAYADAHQPVVPGAYVMLAVSDTGVGMSPEVRARVFEPFFTTKEQGKGTGLGLSTVYGIVKQSGGYVWVYSEPGRGATFKIYLPRVDAPIDVAPRPKEGGTLAGTETVLVAEDDDLLRPLAKNVLEKFGYTVLAAANADAALASARGHQGPIHLLVSDVVMPGASGRELARRLAATHPETKVLFVSGYTDDAIVHHGMLEPGLNYLQKPFTPATLGRKVREVLDAS